MPSHRKSRLTAARKHSRAITLCAATISAACLPAVASASTSSTVQVASANQIDSALAQAKTASAVVKSAPVVVRTVATAVSDTVSTDPTYTVVSGDTLYGIAERSLGSGNKYREIFKLNKGHVESDGEHFTKANLIQIGWTITLPAGSKSAVLPVQPAAAPVAPAATQAPATTAPATTAPSTPATTAPAASSSSSDSSSSDSSSSSSDSSSSSSDSSSSDSSSAGYADDLDGWINQAIAILADNGYTVSYNAIYETAENESSGDPNAENDWDSNAAAGTPSIGLMQVIQPTFDAYALPGYDDIWNPVDNIIAAAIYAQDTYGGLDVVVADRCGGSCWSGY